jgi:hypothetical protein
MEGGYRHLSLKNKNQAAWLRHITAIDTVNKAAGTVG